MEFPEAANLLRIIHSMTVAYQETEHHTFALWSNFRHDMIALFKEALICAELGQNHSVKAATSRKVVKHMLYVILPFRGPRKLDERTQRKFSKFISSVKVPAADFIQEPKSIWKDTVTNHRKNEK